LLVSIYHQQHDNSTINACTYTSYEQAAVLMIAPNLDLSRYFLREYRFRFTPTFWRTRLVLKTRHCVHRFSDYALSYFA